MHELPGSSPLSFVGGGFSQPQQQNQQQYQAQKAPAIEPTTPAETNAERNYRDAANLCEVVAPVAVGSAVVFVFHSLQIAGASIVPIGIYSIYLGAKLSNPHRRWSTAIVGAGVVGGMLLSLAEPIGESQQQSETNQRITIGIKEIHTTGKSGKFQPQLPLEYLPSIALAAILLALFLKGKKSWH